MPNTAVDADVAKDATQVTASPVICKKGKSDTTMNKIKNALIALAVVIGGIPIFLYFLIFQGNLSREHIRWGEFGSFVGGVYGSLSFLILAYSILITKRQFQKQSEDQVFYKLIDTFQNRITNSSLKAGGNIIASYSVFKHIVQYMYSELETECVGLGRRLLCKDTEQIADMYCMKLFQAIKGTNYMETYEVDKEKFIQKLTSKDDFNHRWEELKFYIGSSGEESQPVKEALETIGSVNFYKIPNKDREYCYVMAEERISNKYGDLIDGYLKNVEFILSYISTTINRKLYYDFFLSQLTRYELVLIFYYLASGKVSKQFKLDLKTSKLLDGILDIDSRSLMIDFPSDECIKKELEYLLGTDR